MQIINGITYFEVFELTYHELTFNRKLGLIKPSKAEKRKYKNDRKKLMEELRLKAIKKFKPKWKIKLI